MSGTLIAPPPSSPKNIPCPTSSSQVPPCEARPRPMPIMTAPKITGARIPKRSAIQPKASAPVPEPSHASEFANAAMERGLPKSVAIGLRATGAIRGAPYENVKMNSTIIAAYHDAPVSMLLAGPCGAAGLAGWSEDADTRGSFPTPYPPSRFTRHSASHTPRQGVRSGAAHQANAADHIIRCRFYLGRLVALPIGCRRR